jgi:hypothetical protein
MMRKMLCLFFLSALLAAPAIGQSAAEQAKINYLIDSVAALHDARFIRSGTEYDSVRAADHLRLKLHRSAGRVETALDFIVYCATGSTINGERYRIRFSDGRIVDSAEFLRGKLAAYEARPSHPG